jgi:hypothetical protein
MDVKCGKREKKRDNRVFWGVLQSNTVYLSLKEKRGNTFFILFLHFYY